MKKDSAKDIKIAFFDVDGTLVDMEKKVITPAMIETLCFSVKVKLSDEQLSKLSATFDF